MNFYTLFFATLLFGLSFSNPCKAPLYYQVPTRSCLRVCLPIMLINKAEMTCDRTCPPNQYIAYRECVPSCKGVSMMRTLRDNVCVETCSRTEFNLDDEVCVPVCPPNYFYTYDLLRCTNVCPNFYDDETRRCISSCPMGLYAFGKACVRYCPTGFNEEINSQKCLEKCPKYKIYNQNVCVDKCPSGYYLYSNLCVTYCPVGPNPPPSNICVV